MSEPACVTADRLALYLEDRLEPPERVRTEQHLSDCLECRDRLAGSLTFDEDEISAPVVPESLKRAVRQAPRRVARSVSPWWGAVAAVLMAALGLTFYARFFGPQLTGSDGSETLRSAGSATLEPLAPAAGALLSTEVIQFRWTALPEVRSFTLTVVDGMGNIVFRDDSPESGLTLDLATSGPVFERGQTYYWYVSALLKDGTRLESEIRRWTLARPPPG